MGVFSKLLMEGGLLILLAYFANFKIKLEMDF